MAGVKGALDRVPGDGQHRLHATAEFPAACIGEAALTISSGGGGCLGHCFARNRRSYDLLSMRVSDGGVQMIAARSADPRDSPLPRGRRGERAQGRYFFSSAAVCLVSCLSKSSDRPVA